MNLTVELEEQIMAFLKAKAEAAVPLAFVFDKAFYFASKQDYAARAGLTHTATMEAFFIMIRLRGYTDETTRPMCEDPTTILHYRLALFKEYVAVRKDAESTTSRDDLIPAMINLRKSYHLNQIVIPNIAEHSELKPIGTLTENEESRYLVGVKGDLMEWNLDVEVT